MWHKFHKFSFVRRAQDYFRPLLIDPAANVYTVLVLHQIKKKIKAINNISFVPELDKFLFTWKVIFQATMLENIV